MIFVTKFSSSPQCDAFNLIARRLRACKTAQENTSVACKMYLVP